MNSTSFKVRALVLALIAVPLAACVETGPGPAGATGDLSSFVGARAGQAENGLRARGYQLARTEGLTAYWYNAATGTCAEIVTADGRYVSVNGVSSSACGAGGSMASAAPPTPAEQDCLAAIRRETGNTDVRLIDSSFSEAGTLVRATVGPQNGVWQCIAYRDGSTAGVQFTGNEGTL